MDPSGIDRPTQLTMTLEPPRAATNGLVEPHPTPDASTAEPGAVTPEDQPARGWRSRTTLRLLDFSSPGSLGARARLERWNVLTQRFPAMAEWRVLDLGGTPEAWLAAPVRPRHVLVVNLERFEDTPDWMTSIAADACDLPADVRAGTFDFVYSNSVIEHVGGHDRREHFAANVRALAPHYWVQTPNRYFPIEPHWMFPGMQFLPAPARAGVIRHWDPRRARGTARSRESALAEALSVELVTKSELEFYFPDAAMVRERFFGLTKSIVAGR